MELNLMEAAQAGDIEFLYASIQEDPNILKRIDEIPFVNTPLHVAASAGHTHLAIEIISLMPSFGRKLNPDGLSPLHLALQNGHYQTVKRLVKFDGELVRVQGRQRVTPLHCVANTDNHIDLLAEFLCACPASIKDLTIRDESALHIAVRSSSFRAFNVIFEWLRRTYNRQVLKWRDEEGNTVLHIAVSTNQPQIVRWLVENANMIKNDKNLDKLTALDIALTLDDNAEVRNILGRAKAARAASLPIDCTLEEYLISPERLFEFLLRDVLCLRSELSMEMRNVVLVVAVLIATATFQIVLSSPGGGSHSGGNGNNATSNIRIVRTLLATLAGEIDEGVYFISFYFLNTIAFTTSIMVMIVVLQLRFYSCLLHVSLIFLVGSYGFSLFDLSPSLFSLCLIIVSFTFSFLGYGLKFYLWFLERDITKSTFGFCWMPARSRLQNQRLEMLHRLVN